MWISCRDSFTNPGQKRITAARRRSSLRIVRGFQPIWALSWNRAQGPWALWYICTSWWYAKLQHWILRIHGAASTTQNNDWVHNEGLAQIWLYNYSVSLAICCTIICWNISVYKYIYIYIYVKLTGIAKYFEKDIICLPLRECCATDQNTPWGARILVQQVVVRSMIRPVHVLHLRLSLI